MLLSVHLSAQKELIATATDFISSGNYQAANAFLDSVLKQNKNNVDALMMKGNVILNAALDSSSGKKTWFDENDESVFSESLTDKGAVIHNNQTVAAVANLWKRCLELNPERTDIIKGLCALYSMAGDTTRLRKEILRLKNTEPQDEGQVFRMAEYARKLYAPLGFGAKMDLYRYVAALYTQSAGIRCDIASEYFYAGDFRNCFIWLDSCAAFSNIDETSYLNGAFIYSQLGYFDNAFQWLTRYDTTYGRKMGQFYKGMMQYADNGSTDLLKKFLAVADSNTYYEECRLAQKLSDTTHSVPPAELLKDASASIPEWYKPFIYIRAMKLFPESCEAVLQYGVYQSKLKNYPSAEQFLADGKECKLQGEQAEYWLLNYGYVQYKMKNTSTALYYFKPLLSSKNEFYRQAAVYFTLKVTASSSEKERLEKELNAATKYASLYGNLKH